MYNYRKVYSKSLGRLMNIYTIAVNKTFEKYPLVSIMEKRDWTRVEEGKKYAFL